MRRFLQALSPREDALVLDVGGTDLNWSYVEPLPRVTLLNLKWGDVQADGRYLPFRDKCFDIVFSNSTIEHVGDQDNQATFAREIARVGKAYFVQTPNRYFPVEPHYMTPLVQFLPARVFRRVARNFTVWGWVERPAPEAVDAAADSILLISPSRMRDLFPDAEIRRERLLGLTKSLIAVRRASS
jgi:SAM-dependent methyltransferase